MHSRWVTWCALYPVTGRNLCENDSECWFGENDRREQQTASLNAFFHHTHAACNNLLWYTVAGAIAVTILIPFCIDSKKKMQLHFFPARRINRT